MRAASWVRRFWRGEAGVAGALALLPARGLELVFRGGVALRNAAYDGGLLPVRRAAIPVLGVGNLTVGGTGKTPVAAWLVGRLAERGCTPALVARGYGRDELLLHGRWNPGVPVVASSNRPEAVRRAAERGATVAVLDDGFQHRRLARSADVVLLAAETPFPGRMLPAGPYREGPGALARADLVVVTRKSAPEAEAVALAAEVAARAPGRPVARAWLAPAGWLDLEGRPQDPPRGPLVVATAVAEPETVRRSVRGALAVRAPGRHVDEPGLVTFPDHHEFTADDVARLGREAAGATLVATEKDAVKLRAFRGELPPVAVLTLELRWEEGEEEVEGLLSRIVGLCGESREGEDA